MAVGAVTFRHARHYGALRRSFPVAEAIAAERKVLGNLGKPSLSEPAKLALLRAFAKPITDGGLFVFDRDTARERFTALQAVDKLRDTAAAALAQLDEQIRLYPEEEEQPAAPPAPPVIAPPLAAPEPLPAPGPEAAPAPAPAEPAQPRLLEAVVEEPAAEEPAPGAEAVPLDDDLLPKITIPDSGEIFTVTVGDRDLAYAIYPDVDYRVFRTEGVRYSDLEALALHRRDLEASLSTISHAVGALGALSEDVAYNLDKVRGTITGIERASAKKIRDLNRARDILIGFLTNAKQAISDAEREKSRITFPEKREDETLLDFVQRRKARPALLDKVDATLEDKIRALQQHCGQALSRLTRVRELININDLLKKDEGGAGVFFDNLVIYLEAERTRRIEMDVRTFSLKVDGSRQPTEVVLSRKRDELAAVKDELPGRMSTLLEHMSIVRRQLEELKAAADGAQANAARTLAALTAPLPPTPKRKT